MEIYKAYKDLISPSDDRMGLQHHDQYPMEFQATDFPALAAASKAQGGDARVEMMGTNQAFFFVHNLKGNTDPQAMVLDTAELKLMMERTREFGSNTSLYMDADVLDNPARFAEKYAANRPEEPQVAKALVLREAQLIGDFIKSGGVLELAKEMFAENKHLPEDRVDAMAQKFVREQFHVIGAECAHPLEAATWRVDAPDGALLARQSYSAGTDAAARGWDIGTAPQVQALRLQGDVPAQALFNSVALMDRLPTRELQPLDLPQSKGRAM